MEIRILQPGDDEVLRSVEEDVFDDPVDRNAATEFLRDRRHHIAVAIDNGTVVGFASAVHYIHPDEPRPEMWINEVGVASTHRGRGVGRAILDTLLEHARRLGCTEAWVLTENTNEAAWRLYASCGGIEAPREQVMFTFSLSADRGERS